MKSVFQLRCVLRMERFLTMFCFYFAAATTAIPMLGLALKLVAVGRRSTLNAQQHGCESECGDGEGEEDGAEGGCVDVPCPLLSTTYQRCNCFLVKVNF